MKALTLIQPWAWAIAHAGKDVENRIWRPPESMVGQRIAIHAGKKFDDDAWAFLVDPGCSPIENLKPDENGLIPVPDESDCIRGAIIAVATIDHIKAIGEGPARFSPWYGGPYGWVLRDVIALRDSIECRGAQKLWTVQADHERAIADQIEAQRCRVN